MSRQTKLDPKEHISGEWNIITLNRYLPISDGNRVNEKLPHGKEERAALVQKAKALYTTGMTNAQIANTLNISPVLVARWKQKDWLISLYTNGE